MAKAAASTTANEGGLAVAEPVAERGAIDVALGRGRTGKTTWTRWAIERARDTGRRLRIGDGDRNNRTLSSFYADDPNLSAPPAADELSVKGWLEDLTQEVIDGRGRLVLDMGGGDRAFANVSEKHSFAEVLPENGVDLTAWYFLAGGRDDYETLVFMEEIGFRPARTAIVLNEGLAPPAASGRDPFAKILDAAPVKAVLARGARLVRMPAVDLDTMVAADDLFVGIRAASKGAVPRGQDGAPVAGYKALNLWKRNELKRWLEEMGRRHEAAGVADWLP